MPAACAPSMSQALLIAPAVNGAPIMPSAAIENAAALSGMRRPAPSVSLTLWMPSVSAKLPAQKKSVTFMMPWCTRCTRPPTVPTGPNRVTPSTM